MNKFESNSERLARLKASLYPPTTDPFLLSDWRKYIRTKSKVWAYNRVTGQVKACSSIGEANKWLDGCGRYFNYQDEENVEQVLRSLS